MKQLMKIILLASSLLRRTIYQFFFHMLKTRSNRKGIRILYENNEFRFEESTFPRNGTALISSVSNKY